MATDPDINPGALAEALNNKTDTDVQNTTTTGDVRISHLAMPSSKWVDITPDVSGATYIAPADGYYCISRISSASNQYLSAIVEDTASNATLYGDARFSVGNGNYVTLTIPIMKGNRLHLYYSIPTHDFFHFVYAVGSEPQS